MAGRRAKRLLGLLHAARSDSSGRHPTNHECVLLLSWTSVIFSLIQLAAWV